MIKTLDFIRQEYHNKSISIDCMDSLLDIKLRITFYGSFQAVLVTEFGTCSLDTNAERAVKELVRALGLFDPSLDIDYLYLNQLVDLPCRCIKKDNIIVAIGHIKNDSFVLFDFPYWMAQ